MKGEVQGTAARKCRLLAPADQMAKVYMTEVRSQKFRGGGKLQKKILIQKNNSEEILSIPPFLEIIESSCKMKSIS